MINISSLEREERKSAFEEELSNLPEGWIILLETSAEKALEVSLLAIKILTDKNYVGFILSASRPYSNLISLYGKNNINTKKIVVLDCISKSQGLKQEESENMVYYGDISNLTGIAILVDKSIERIKDKKFIFVDSITTMLIHNKPDVFAKFIHNILTKMRLNEISGLLISLENETNNEVRAEIAQLCDKIIKI